MQNKPEIYARQLLKSCKKQAKLYVSQKIDLSLYL